MIRSTPAAAMLALAAGCSSPDHPVPEPATAIEEKAVAEARSMIPEAEIQPQPAATEGAGQ